MEGILKLNYYQSSLAQTASDLISKSNTQIAKFYYTFKSRKFQSLIYNKQKTKNPHSFACLPTETETETKYGGK